MALKGNLVIIAIFFLSLLGTLALSQATSRSSYGVKIDETFEQWMRNYSRVYPSSQEKERRLAIFQTNLEYVNKFNLQENKTYRLGLNRFSDMTTEEFLLYNTGYKRIPTTSFRYQNLSEDDIPNSIDWRKQGAVTPVKDQGGCGCCWAFSVVGAVEGIIAIKGGQLISLSEQQLVDCNRDLYNAGCEGGSMVDGFQYIQQNGGITGEDNYPYTATDGACDNNKEKQHAATITGFEKVPEGEMNLLKAVSRQPVSIGISLQGQDFQHYQSGVFSGDCGRTLDHAATVVGYGTTQEGTTYWLIKNSWGDYWAENGYFRVLRDNGQPEGECGIAIEGAYPTA